jgi:2-polyprenyl-3-methyl-5-hydroxy-6-metoxy-1,4-benzoquinol methylase
MIVTGISAARGPRLFQQEFLMLSSVGSARHTMPDSMDYATKTPTYFHGERRDFVDALPLEKLSFLEIGCGSGATARYARQTGRVARYTGVELFPEAAEQARPAMDLVVTGNVEALDLPTAFAPYDVAIMSEVLEHLVDPWRLLKRLRPLMADNATLFASSPSIAHHSVIRMLLKGRWDLEDFGRMDRTHLRWFTPSSYAAMFEDCGYRVEAVENMTTLSPRARLLHAVLPRSLKHLVVGQMLLRARC